MVDGRRLLGVLGESGALYGDVFVEGRDYSQVQLESGRPERVERAVDAGVGMRLIMPWKSYHGSASTLEEGELLELASSLARLAERGEDRFRSPARRRSGSYPFSLSVRPDGVGLAEKVELVRRVDRMAREMEPRIGQVRVAYRDTSQKVTIYSSDGEVIEDERVQVVLNLLVIGSEGSDVQTAYEAIGGFYGYEFFTAEAVDELVRKTVRRLSGLLGAAEAPMGTKTVVLASEAGGTMIHEAIGHGLEADLAMEGLSCYKDLIGQTIASPLIGVVDDATVPNMRGTYAFDDEGTPAQRTALVEGGVLKSYLFDRFHALRYGKRPTGNGRRESFRHRPIPRMSNTMILPGRDDPAAIIASVDEGVYVVKMGGGQVDTVRGDFVFEISEGYLIEKGRVGTMVKNATMAGNGLAVLKGIDMVGDDLGFGIGTCGKDGQGVPVADAQPTLRIPRIVVGGRQAG